MLPQEIRLLVVEDNADLLELLASILSHQGWQVSASQRPDAALQNAHQYPPALLITDHDMPGCTGLTLLERLRDLEGLDRLPAILLSGHASGHLPLPDDVLWLQKPITPSQLCMTVERMLGRRTATTH